MRSLFRALLLALVFVPFGSLAAPFVYSDPYTSALTQPDKFTMTINGGAPLDCLVDVTPTGPRAKCDLASITADGVYTLLVTAHKTGGIVNEPGVSATNTVGSSAPSNPFRYTLNRAPVTGPIPTVGP